MLVLTFIGLPFVVRTVQPVLEDLDPETEEAAAAWARARWQTFRRVILPTLYPALVTGFALAFARCLGEYGSVVFVSGNMPFKTEIAPVLIVARLEEFAYAEATAIAVVLLVISFAMLIADQPPRTLEPSAWRLSPGDRSAGAAAACGARSRIRCWCAALLIGAAVLAVGVLVVVPVGVRLRPGPAPRAGAYSDNLVRDRDTRHAILLTLTVAPIAVVLNLVFGVAAAWVIARFRFPGRTLLTTLIDLPFSVSPVVAGLMFVLIFGLQGYFGPWLRDDGYCAPCSTSSRSAAALVVFVAGADRPAAAAMPLRAAALGIGVVALAAVVFARARRRAGRARASGRTARA